MAKKTTKKAAKKPTGTIYAFSNECYGNVILSSTKPSVVELVTRRDGVIDENDVEREFEDYDEITEVCASGFETATGIDIKDGEIYKLTITSEKVQ